MFALLTEEEREFIAAILLDPAEHTGWLAYADWLDDRSDPRSTYIRLEVKRAQLPHLDPERRLIRSKLDQIRPTLDPDWVAVFDHTLIENCPTSHNFKCPRKWERLRGTTDQPSVRPCGVCNKSVHFCPDVETAREHVALGDPVALRSGLTRTATDLMSSIERDTWEHLLLDPRLNLGNDSGED